MRSSTYLSTLAALFLFFFFASLHAQVIPEPVTDESIYSFLDELAIDGIIDFNQAVKPYSRKMISELLGKAEGQKEEMTLQAAERACILYNILRDVV